MQWQDCLSDLAYLHGRPVSSGDIRCHDQDFMVEECLGFELSGEGEHVCLFIEKQGENTLYVARQIAKIAGARNRDVSYSGLKDRHGVTRQWFSVAVPVKTTLDWSALNTDNIKVIKHTRHLKKLRTGCHRANNFSIVVRNISDMADIERRIALIEQQGVPNYFGEQRFGIGANNLNLAQRMFDGENIRDRKLRGLVISAARSLLFNLLVSQRVNRQQFNQPMAGDVFRLAGSRSFFSDTIDEALLARLRSGDIQIAAIMPGDGQSPSSEQALEFEQQVLNDYQHWVDGLKALRVAVDCRPIRLIGQALQLTVLDQTTIQLDFTLPTGSFATALLRELLSFEDKSQRQKSEVSEPK